jgi:branched-chain amino acid transport system permease protein
VVVVASPLPTSARDLVTFTILLLVLTVRPNGLYGVARRTKV